MSTQPETCSECDECCFSWYDNEWHCGDGNDETFLDNDVYTSVPDNCPLRKERDI